MTPADDRPPPYQIVSEPPDNGDPWGCWPLVGLAVLTAIAVTILIGAIS